jgi:long-chain acyl-CoA synthetase
MKTESQIKYTKTLSDFLEEDKSKYPTTLGALLEYCVKTHGDRPAMGKAFEPPLTYNQLWARVVQVSELLNERGVSQGDRVAILGENCPNWGIGYFAAVRIGAVAVPILPDFPEADILHILSDSEVRILFTTGKQLEKISSFEHTKIKHIIMLDDFESCDSELNIEPLSEIFDKAVDFLKKIPKSMGLASREISENDTASIIYTSGTSGHSKAVMLSHRNLISNAAAASSLANLSPDDVILSILPLSHSYEFTLGFVLPLLNGVRIVYLSKTPTPRLIEQAGKAEKPTVMCAVPLILEKIYKKKVLPALEKNLALKMITKIPGLKKAIYKKINKKLIDFFGGRLALIAVGGAPLNREAEKFFNAAGFPYLIGYGLTETSPLVAGGPRGDKSIRVSSTGKVTPGCEIKIVDPDEKTGIGEIYVRGPNIMKGYYKNPGLTAEVLDDQGWFKTGDLGFFDKHDNLYIKGRSKNMLLMANGENIYPEAVEEKINASMYVMESLVIENNSQLEAWVYLDYELIDQETKGKSETERYDYIKEILTQIKQDVNQRLSSFSKIARIYEQEEPFVKTATHKIKRYLYTHNQSSG